MLPLALLGVLIVDPSYATLEATRQRVLDVPSLFPVLWRFFVLFVVLEGALRVARLGVMSIRKRHDTHDEPAFDAGG